MQDLTQGSIPKHVLRMAAPIMIGMLFQTLYFLIDLYFVARLGDAAIAGVGAAGNVQFIVMALTQILGVGTMALISHAVGRKDRDDANLVFNQSLLLALTCAAITLVLGYALGGAYMRTLGADAATTQHGIDYLYWFLPGLALQFAQIAMGSALRGTGIAKPTMVVQMLTVILNAILAPVLIAGWLTGKPMGVAGAGLATSISVAAGVVMMALYFARLEKYVGFDPSQFHARLAVWKRILRIGLPPGGEFALMFVYMAVIYWVIRGFGAEAQAGFGIGQRVMQAIFLPAMAVAFATAPVAGQNVGAGRPDRVRATFHAAVAIGVVLMLALTALCQWRPDWLVGVFTQETAVIAVAAQFLSIISLNFVASGLIFTCSGMFQALGNTLPAFASSASRMLTFALPAVWLSTRPDFELRQLWLLSVASVTLQAILSVVLLLRALRQADTRMAAAPA
ncbi:MATE family efflux transporter [Lysobacter sp. Root604]|uniref:MATE family efflux transporter n=1 Tax=Lysobacter sp. Root604 TaxID=1736568 RepID=UPI0006F51162|nr:MATE family efflux transporter [Lysobacter sp. Root604]KRA16310.1 MATE family efflux transporter [Lysobacter sp. Root604]